MPKPYSFPVLYDETLQISISNLKKWGYLQTNQVRRGELNWSFNGTPTASISFLVNTTESIPFIQLEYKHKGKQKKYRIYLESKTSNLNKGKIWYFVCPQTNKLCRKLYLISGYFLHREAFKGCMYETQVQSKSYRQLKKVMNTVFKLDELYSELEAKHFKRTYAGKPTKKYLKILQQIEQAEKVSSIKINEAINNF